MRASSTLRGTLPGRNPGTRTWCANVRTTSPMARSNSGSSTSTLRRTRFPSIGSVVARITKRQLYRCGRVPDRTAHPPGDPPRPQNMKFMALRTRRPMAASPSVATPPAASTCSAVARPQPRRRKSRLDSATVTGGATSSSVVPRPLPFHQHGEDRGRRRPGRRRRSAPRWRRGSPPACRPRRAWRPAPGRARWPTPGSRCRPDGRGRAGRPARAPSSRRRAPP